MRFPTTPFLVSPRPAGGRAHRFARAGGKSCGTKLPDQGRTARGSRRQQGRSSGQAIKSARNQGHRAEVVRARLCRHDEILVYVLTLLGQSGKVTNVTVDASNGEPTSR